MSARGEPDLSDLLDQALQRAQTSGLAFLSPLGPLLMAAAALGLAKDSRGFARRFDLAHALVLRELVSLEADLGLVITENRDERTSRLWYRLSDAGMAVLQGAPLGDD